MADEADMSQKRALAKEARQQRGKERAEKALKESKGKKKEDYEEEMIETDGKDCAK